MAYVLSFASTPVAYTIAEPFLATILAKHNDCDFRYGLLDKSKWPYWSVGALSQSNTFYSAGPLGGCG